MKVVAFLVFATSIFLASAVQGQTPAPKPSSSAPATQAPSPRALVDTVRVRNLPAALSEAERTKAAAIVALLKTGADAEAKTKLRELSNDLVARKVSRATLLDLGSYLGRRGLLDSAPDLLQAADRLRFALDKKNLLMAQIARLNAAIAKLVKGGTTVVEIVTVRSTFALDADPVANREQKTLGQEEAKTQVNEAQAMIDLLNGEAKDATDVVYEARTLRKLTMQRLVEWLEARQEMASKVLN